MKLTLTREARQNLQNARLGCEKAIKEAKAITRAPHRDYARVAKAQNDLLQLKREATLIYGAIAASRGRVHSPKALDLLDRIRNLAAKGYPISANERLVLGLPWAPTEVSAAA